MHADSMIGPIETMTLAEESPTRGTRRKGSPSAMGWGSNAKVAAVGPSPLSKLAAGRTTQSEISSFRQSPDANAGPSTRQ
jgi:hypothetical protein